MDFSKIFRSISGPVETTQTAKSAEEIVDEQVRAGLEQYRRSNQRLFLSSFAAGMELGFSLFLIGILYQMFHGYIPDNFLYILIAQAYSLGFIFVIIGKSQLFTEHTALALLPVLRGNATVPQLLWLWVVIFTGNLLGGYLFAFILSQFAPAMGIISEETFVTLALKMIDFNWWIILVSGILAGWLMGLLSWLIASTSDTISKIVIVFLITSVIGLGGLHHAIAGSIEVFAGLLISHKIGLSEYVHFQWWTTLGNIIGGSVFVALMKYGTVKSHK